MSDAEAEKHGEFIERLHDDGAHTGLIVIAPHGGRHRGAHRRSGATGRMLLGRQGGELLAVQGLPCARRLENLAHHFGRHPSRKLSFAQLGILPAFPHAVAFHGFETGRRTRRDSRRRRNGGGRIEGGDRIDDRKALRTRHSVRIAGPDDPNGGDDPCNIVNRLTIGGANGVQIEQTLAARDRARSRHRRSGRACVSDAASPSSSVRHLPAVMITYGDLADCVMR